MLTITSELLARIHAHLEAGYPNEACGILLGDLDANTKVVKDLALVANELAPWIHLLEGYKHV